MLRYFHRPGLGLKYTPTSDRPPRMAPIFTINPSPIAFLVLVQAYRDGFSVADSSLRTTKFQTVILLQRSCECHPFSGTSVLLKLI